MDKTFDNCSVAIWGIKSRAVALYSFIKDHYKNIRCCYFIRPNLSCVYPEKEKDIFNNKLSPSIDSLEDIPVVFSGNLFEVKDKIDYIFIPQKNISERFTFFELRYNNYDFSKVIIIDSDEDFSSVEFIPYMDCRFLPYIEFHVEDKCNLNCNACEHYSPFVKESKQPVIHDFKESLEKLKKYFDEIAVIRILGGEPLLNKNVVDFAKFSREKFPNSNIRIVTNGILIPTLSDDFLSQLKLYKIGFDISLYPPLAKKIETTVSNLKRLNVEYTISPELSKFFLKNRITPMGNKDEIYRKCFQGLCVNLYEGKIATCFLPFVQHYFNSYFNLDIPENEYLDLNSPDLTTRKIKDFLNSSIERCRFCGLPKCIEWKQEKKNHELSEWCVDFVKKS